MNRRALFSVAADAVAALALAVAPALGHSRAKAQDLPKLSPYSLPCHDMKEHPCRLTVRNCFAAYDNPARFDPEAVRITVERSVKHARWIA